MEVFKIFDRDEDGYLTRVECKQLLLESGYEDINHIDNMLDQIEDGEGMIACSDYANKMLENHIQP